MVLPWWPNHVKVYVSLCNLCWIFLRKTYLQFEIKKHQPSITATLILSVCGLRKLSPSFFSSESHTPPPEPISGLRMELSSIRLWLHISNSGTVRTDTALKVDVSSRYGTCTHSHTKTDFALCVSACWNLQSVACAWIKPVLVKSYVSHPWDNSSNFTA